MPLEPKEERMRRLGWYARLTMSAVTFLILGGCTPKNPGCMERSATNFDFDANSDDGSCTFTRVAFYIGTTVPFGALPVTVTLDGQTVGTITGIYPGSQPGNCTADFTASIFLPDGRTHDWNARSAPYLPGGGFASNSGKPRAT
jgi:hypothetical protein